MNGLAIDTAISKITISAKKNEHVVSAIFDIGMKHSETLLPAIQYVLEKVNCSISELNYICVSNGPGSFTGLRLGFSAAKAIQMVSSAPLYGIDSLDLFAENYKNLPFPIVSLIDAKKDRFYVKAFLNGGEVLKDSDITIEEIVNFINSRSEDSIFLCGSGAKLLEEQIKANETQSTDAIRASFGAKKLICADFNINSGEILLKIAEQKIANGEKPLNDYDGPFYLRASEAEVKRSE